MNPTHAPRLAALTLLFAATAGQHAQAADWPAGFSKCADENGTCKVGTTARSVSFGIRNQFVVKTFAHDVPCDVRTFGSDPAHGQVKKCAVAPIGTPTPTPSPTPAPTPAPVPPPPSTDAARDVAPTSGWAGYAGGTSGGAKAAAADIHEVSTASALVAAVKATGTAPRIIKVVGRIDLAAADNGGVFRSESDQAARGELKLPSGTTLIGVGADAGLVNANVMIRKVENVIVRNLTIVNPCDVAPKWDSSDGSSGNWNSEFDGITVDGAQHVWIDHNRFTDQPRTDDLSASGHGKLVQCHDGAVDIKDASDYVTLSFNVFDHHDKNDLVGSSDSDTGDAGHLKVTFNDNWFSAITQRTPRVRFGQVHLYDNLYTGSKADQVYPHAYSIGVGFDAKVRSEQNVFEITGASSCHDIVQNPGSSSKPGAIVDTGSMLNGAPMSLGACAMSAAVGWTVPYDLRGALVSATAVKAIVTAQAGPGRIAVAR
jgi:pectate lyase